MKSQEIPEEEWIRFGDAFSREHAGWPVTIELLGQDTGPQRLGADLPLQGISFDRAGTRPSSIEISAGGGPGTHVSHTVDLPLYIRVAEDEAGAGGTLQIEPARGPQTLVHFHRPA